MPGRAFGALRSRAGEVVFNTGMTGYPEALTDPSYRGQILVLTYPLVGNYGVPARHPAGGLERRFESSRIQVAGLIVTSRSAAYSHYSAVQGLSDWLRSEGVPGLSGVDTRGLTRHLRSHGTLLGRIEIDGEVPWFDPAQHDLVAAVSRSDVHRYGRGRRRALLIDCGAKNRIIHHLVQRGLEVICVPWDHDLSGLDFDGILVSNGPGDPRRCGATVETLRRHLALGTPTFGICLGHQLLGLAAGAEIVRLPYGHRGQNQPVLEVGTDRALITSQNHGYAVEDKTLPDGWAPWFRNLNDGSNEGIRHESGRFCSVQFHPEAAPGPVDASGLFDRFREMLGGDRVQVAVPAELPAPPRPKTVLILGSSALKIGEAGEFDYSGSQALKALREEGIRTVVVNPNIATVQTSERLADEVYFLPVTPEFVEQVIASERPDGILLSFGGQTALNCGLALHESGVLDRYGVRVLGTGLRAIADTEDRALFVQRLDEVDARYARSAAAESLPQAHAIAQRIGYPVMVRIAYALGGLGSGVCRDEAQLTARVKKALAHTTQVLVEEYLEGWKEVEYEVVRDRFGNCITVCNMENLDPMGIHTGESIVVAPSQTLTDEEYHHLREVSIRVISHLGVVGECNIQFALSRQALEYRIIEVNARLSRSSALASKATGYPLAFVAAKLALGYGLHELKNALTGTTPAMFEPALDYVAVKVPRWDLDKFRKVSRVLGSGMKSVGEVMALARTFEEAIQKALRMLETGAIGLIPSGLPDAEDIDEILARPTETRIFAVAEALRRGYDIERIHRLSFIDHWFLQRIECLVELAGRLEGELTAELLREAKQGGFSDRQIARIRGASVSSVRSRRHAMGIRPVLRQIDTLAAEYPANTNYLYLTYHGDEDDVVFSGERPRALILGSGAYRIGSSVEFDWCCVTAGATLRSLGHETIMLNYNPETVSTDYDQCDSLVFDEISEESVLELCEKLRPTGVMVSVGGQIPNNLALSLHRHGVPILGTCPTQIDRAENRHTFSSLLDSIDVDQPEWQEVSTAVAAASFAERVGYPVLVRPSYVLSGAAMAVAEDRDQLERYLARATAISPDHPVVLSRFLSGALEIEFDGVARRGEVLSHAISEHVENAGVHSGDATLVVPSQELTLTRRRRIREIAGRIAAALEIHGPFNVQFLVRDGRVRVIECNLRASRSFPFVSKVLRHDLIEEATRVMAGAPVTPRTHRPEAYGYVGVKAPQFSFARLAGADPTVGVEMSSTGEVGCLGTSFDEAFLKALLSVGYRRQVRAVLLSTGSLASKQRLLGGVRSLADAGIRIFATEGTARFLRANGVGAQPVEWPLALAEPSATSVLEEGRVDLVINIPKSPGAIELTNGYLIRRAAVDFNVPLITNEQVARRFAEAVSRLPAGALSVRPWSAYRPAPC